MNATVLVVGGTGGIGRAIVEKLLTRDISVILAALDVPDRASSIASSRLQMLRVDVTQEQSVVDLFDRIEREHGNLSAMVIAAGVGILKPLAGLSMMEWSTTVASQSDRRVLVLPGSR